jgi:hypothetical protein
MFKYFGSVTHPTSALQHPHEFAGAFIGKMGVLIMNRKTPK